MIPFPFQFGGFGSSLPVAAGGGGDPYFSNVSLLMHFDGTNGSTTYTDSSNNAHSFTVNGNAQLITSEKKFGTASGYFNGVGDYINTVATTDLNLSSGDFTIECFIYPTAKAGNLQIINKDGAAGSSYPQYSLDFTPSNTVRAIIGSGNGVSSLLVITSTTTLSLNTQHHVALVKNGSTLTLYINGVSEASNTTVTMVEGGKDLLIGYSTGASAGDYFAGCIDELRITKGVARYTANFTPPTAAFPNN